MRPIVFLLAALAGCVVSNQPDPISFKDADGDGFLSDVDCHDGDPTIYPGADERCNGRDDDCDGIVDESGAVDGETWYVDRDGDGAGDLLGPALLCVVTPGYVLDASDCDDGDALVAPGASERCNGIDDDCDGEIDEGTGDIWYPDADGDGAGDAQGGSWSCEAPSGWLASGSDCDDTNPDVHPGAVEVCNDLDDDCNGLRDDADPALSDLPIWYADADGDGWGVSGDTRTGCDAPLGYVSSAGDCDDSQPARNPGQDEVCFDGLDNDCDGQTDDSGAVDALQQWADDDGDGFGTPLLTLRACDLRPDFVENAEDCDDNNAARYPGALELCDGVDQDCLLDGDGPAPWWDASFGWRIPIEVQAPPQDLPGPAVWVDLDFDAVLGVLGAPVGFDPAGMRVVREDCGGLGMVEVPSQFIGTRFGLFAGGDATDPAGDGRGTVAFRVDEDGDLGSPELLAGGSVARFAIYYGINQAAPAYPSDLSVRTNQLANAELVVDLSSLSGGVVSGLRLASSPDLLDQRVAEGNGVHGVDWLTVPQAASDDALVVASGPLVGMVEHSGTRSDGEGAFDYLLTHWIVTGQSALYTRVRMVATAPGTISASPQWVAGVRPWQGVINLSGSSVLGVDYVDLSDGSWGLGVGWAVRPSGYSDVYLAAGEARLVGNDLGFADGMASRAVSSGQAIVDGAVVLVMPHAGAWSTVSSEFLGLQRGVSARMGDAEALP